MCSICGDWTHDNQESVHHTVSRRRLLQTGAAVVGAGAVMGSAASVRLIRSRGHLPKGGYDVRHGITQGYPTRTAAVH